MFKRIGEFLGGAGVAIAILAILVLFFAGWYWIAQGVVDALRH